MSAIIIGGNECMGRTYRDLCAKYNITARAIPLKKGSFANQLGNPDYIFVCMDTVSHPLVISAHTNLNLNICKHASGFFVIPRRRPAGLLPASQGTSTPVWRKRCRRIVSVWVEMSINKLF